MVKCINLFGKEASLVGIDNIVSTTFIDVVSKLMAALWLGKGSVASFVLHQADMLVHCGFSDTVAELLVPRLLSCGL